MVQTGIPFGDVTMVRDWLGLEVRWANLIACTPSVRSWDSPATQRGQRHPSVGLGVRTVCHAGKVLRDVLRRELLPAGVSRGERPQPHARQAAAVEQAPLFAACDEALRRLVEAMQPTHVVGVGHFAFKRAQTALSGFDVEVGTILHPSPASPLANRGWAAAASRQLAARELGCPVDEGERPGTLG